MYKSVMMLVRSPSGVNRLGFRAVDWWKGIGLHFRMPVKIGVNYRSSRFEHRRIRQKEIGKCNMASKYVLEPQSQVDIDEVSTWTAFDEMNNKIGNDDELTVDDWERLRESLFGLPYDEDKTTTRSNVDTVILRHLVGGGRISTGESFYKYLIKVRKSGLSWSQYDYILKLLLTVDNFGDQEQFAREVTEDVLDKGYNNILPHMFWNCIEIQSRTSCWKEATSKALSIPYKNESEAGSVQAFTGLALQAFQYGEYDLMWKLMNNRRFHQDIILLRETSSPGYKRCHNKMYLNWISHCHNIQMNGQQEKLANQKMEELYHYFERHSILLTDDVRDAIVDFYSRSSSVTAVQTNIDSETARCVHCKSELDRGFIGEETLKQLRKKVEELVVGITKDVYSNTDPREYEKFQKLVKNWGPFDVVVDGLNVQLSKLPKRYQHSVGGSSTRLPFQLNKVCYQSLNLLDVVKHFTNQGLKVLVVNRKKSFYALESHKKIMKVATCILLNSVTEDDPYMILAALHSGNGCKLVSNDLLRQHSATLAKYGSPHLAKLFTEWQSLHQIKLPQFAGYHLNSPTVKFSDPQFVMPPSHSIKANISPPYWHLPLLKEVPESLNIPSAWLCVGPNTSESGNKKRVEI